MMTPGVCVETGGVTGGTGGHVGNDPTAAIRPLFTPALHVGKGRHKRLSSEAAGFGSHFILQCNDRFD